jgi:acylglycerol lipase
MSLGFQCPDFLTPRLKDITVPFFCMHGSADEVTDPAFSQQLYDVSTSTDKTLKIVHGARHGDCLFEVAMFDEVGEWIGQRVGSSEAHTSKALNVRRAEGGPEEDSGETSQMLSPSNRA